MRLMMSVEVSELGEAEFPGERIEAEGVQATYILICWRAPWRFAVQNVWKSRKV